jgi:hypothetical protein
MPNDEPLEIDGKGPEGAVQARTAPVAPSPAAAAPPLPRPVWQYSLQTLLVLTSLLACGLAAWRATGWRTITMYAFLVFAVGPWFAWLVGESLWITDRRLRSGVANLVLTGLLAITLFLAEMTFAGHSILLVFAIAAVLWPPQYLAFFWRREMGP